MASRLVKMVMSRDQTNWDGLGCSMFPADIWLYLRLAVTTDHLYGSSMAYQIPAHVTSHVERGIASDFKVWTGATAVP